MLTINDYPYFQPEWYKDDDTNIEYGGMPDELYSFQAFQTEEECRQWLINHDYNPDEFVIHEYCNDDIEEVSLIDANDNTIPKIEELDDETIEDMLVDVVQQLAGPNLHATRRTDETHEQFMDRVYGEALDNVNSAICSIEESNEFDFSNYGGNPDIEWYDEARDIAVGIIIKYMTKGQE